MINRPKLAELKILGLTKPLYLSLQIYKSGVN